MQKQKKDVTEEIQNALNEYKYELDCTKLTALYWDERAKISYLQTFVLVNSILSMEEGMVFVPKEVLERTAKQLKQIQDESEPKYLIASTFYYLFKKFDGKVTKKILNGITQEHREALGDLIFRVKRMRGKAERVNRWREKNAKPR